MAENEQKSYWHDALLAFGRMSGWIVGPILLALFLGKWLDMHFHTAPWIFVGTTATAFIVSMTGLLVEGKRYLASVADTAQKTTNERNESDSTTH